MRRDNSWQNARVKDTFVSAGNSSIGSLNVHNLTTFGLNGERLKVKSLVIPEGNRGDVFYSDSADWKPLSQDILTGTSLPSTTMGKPSDNYIDRKTGLVYLKNADEDWIGDNGYTVAGSSVSRVTVGNSTANIDGRNGDMYVNTLSNSLFYRRNINWCPVSYEGITGQSGLTGSTQVGLTGLTGWTGLTGLTGLTGCKGLTGLNGLTGLTGLTGVNGVRGLTGGSAYIFDTQNTVFGNTLFISNTGSTANTACGDHVLQFLQSNSASFCSGFGSSALASNIGSSNSAMGSQSLMSNTTGTGNTAFGSQAATASTTSSGICAFGKIALSTGTTGIQYSSAFGAQSAFRCLTAATALGGLSMVNCKTTFYCTSVGQAVIPNLASGSNVSSVGCNNMFNTTSGNDIVCFGFNNMYNATSPDRSVSLGSKAIQTSGGTDLIGCGYSCMYTKGNTGNIAVGATAAFYIGTGATQNTMFGAKIISAASSALTAVIVNNTIFGSGSMQNSVSPNDNVTIGSFALNAWNGTTGQGVFLGSFAGASGASGEQNVALGYSTLKNAATSSNVAVGSQAGSSITSGSLQNTLLGSLSATSLGTGLGKNVCIGTSTARNLTTGTSNIILGQGSAPSSSTGSNQIVIGAGCTGKADSCIQVGLSSAPITTCYIDGISLVNVASGINVVIDSNGQLGTTSSSRTVKTQIRSITEEFAKQIYKIRSTRFKYRQGEQIDSYGFIAEEVQKVYPELVVHDKDGNVETVQYPYFYPIILRCLQIHRERLD